MFDDDNGQIEFVICLCASVTLGAATLVGSEFARPGYLKEGRDAGVIFCIEKPIQCRTEYNYLKLKETQK